MTPYRISDFNHFGGLIELFLILKIDALQNVKKSSTIFTMMFAAKDVTMATGGALKCSYKIETKFLWVRTRKVLSSGTEQNWTVELNNERERLKEKKADNEIFGLFINIERSNREGYRRLPR